MWLSVSISLISSTRICIEEVPNTRPHYHKFDLRGGGICVYSRTNRLMELSGCVDLRFRITRSENQESRSTHA